MLLVGAIGRCGRFGIVDGVIVTVRMAGSVLLKEFVVSVAGISVCWGSGGVSGTGVLWSLVGGGAHIMFGGAS